MKKFVAIVLSVIAVGSNLLSIPVSAGWARESVSVNGATGYLYCSTGVNYYPAGYCASIEASAKKNFAIAVSYMEQGGSSTQNDSVSDYNDYLYIELDGVSISYVGATFTVNGTSEFYFADAR